MDYTFSFQFIGTYWQFFLDGLWMTLALSAISLVLSTFFGTLMGLLRIARSKVLRTVSAAYVEFVAARRCWCSCICSATGSSSCFRRWRR